VIDTGRGAEQNHAILWIEFRRRLCHRLLRENGVYALTGSGRATLVALLERARIIHTRNKNLICRRAASVIAEPGGGCGASIGR
jgi:hypothetical protein